MKVRSSHNGCDGQSVRDNSRGSFWSESVLRYTFVRTGAVEMAKLREGRNGTEGESAAQS